VLTKKELGSRSCFRKKENTLPLKPKLFGGKRPAGPPNSKILAELGKMATSSCLKDSKRNLLFDIICLGHFVDPCVSKYAQPSPTRIDYHVYPSGNKVLKAFTASNFAFYNKVGNILELLDSSCLDQAHDMTIIMKVGSIYSL